MGVHSNMFNPNMSTFSPSLSAKDHEQVTHNAILTLPVEAEVENKEVWGIFNIILIKMMNSSHSQTNSLNCKLMGHQGLLRQEKKMMENGPGPQKHGFSV